MVIIGRLCSSLSQSGIFIFLGFPVITEKKSKHLQYRDNYNQYGAMQSQPQAHSFTFQSSSVTYGGANGAYYTSSKTRRMGSDGVSNFERFIVHCFLSW